jgi:hypothetical protein
VNNLLSLLRAAAGLIGYAVLCLRFGPLREAAKALLDLLKALCPTWPAARRGRWPSRAGRWAIAVLVAHQEAFILLGPPVADAVERVIEAVLAW